MWTSILIAACILFMILPSNIWFQKDSIETTPSFSEGASEYIESDEYINSEKEETLRYQGKKDMENKDTEEQIPNLIKESSHVSPKNESLLAEEKELRKPSSQIKNSNKRSLSHSMPSVQKENGIASSSVQEHKIYDQGTGNVDNNVGIVSQNEEQFLENVDQVNTPSAIPMQEMDFEQSIAVESWVQPEEVMRDDRIISTDSSGTTYADKSIEARESSTRNRAKRKSAKTISQSTDDLDSVADGSIFYLQMKLQIRDVSGMMELDASDLVFAYVDGNIVPYKDLNNQWVFSVPSGVSGSFIVKGVKSDILVVQSQYTCLWERQKLICKEP